MTEHPRPPVPLRFPLRERCQESSVAIPAALAQGRPCWLLFHPLAYAPTCREDLAAVQREAAGLGHPDVALVAVSVDGEGHARGFHEDIGATALEAWSDPDQALARRCGVARDDGVCERASVLVGADGRVRQAAIHPFCFPRPLDQLKAWLPSLREPAD